MSNPRLSILIPSIPSRWDKARELFDHIQSLIGDKDIECLLLMDNKTRTIGEKREALKNASNGKYFMFVDDDDSLYSVQEIYDATANDVDVITFKSKCRNSDGSEYIVTFGLKNEVEHNTENGRYLDCKRPPFTQCAWSERFKSVHYPATNYGEDWSWVEQCLPIAYLSTHIDLVLHGYNFDPEVSEAVYYQQPDGTLTGLTDPSLLMNQPIIGPDILMLSTNGGDFNPMVCSNESFNSEPPSRCIVNLATGPHIKGQVRLKHELDKFWNEPVLLFQNEGQVKAPLHFGNAYAFKVYAIDEAIERGYEQILWLDASVYPIKDPTPVFDWLSLKGIFLEEAGHYVGQWCNDRTLEYFGITRDEAMTMPMFSGGFIGLDFRRQISVEFFNRWKKAMQDGMFHGSWADHRHDMTVGSIIANQMNLVKDYSRGGHFFAYTGPGYAEPQTSVTFYVRGL